MDTEFSLSLSTREGVPVITLTGDVTVLSQDKIISAWEEVLSQDSQEVVFDFTVAKYVNSSGIAALLKLVLSQEARTKLLVFVGVSIHLKKVLDAIGLVDLVEIADSVEDWFRDYKKP